jgi:hypothetical protein
MTIVVLHNLEVNTAFLEVVAFVDSKSDGNRLRVVPANFMFFYRGVCCSSAVFGRCRGWEMPFYIGGAVDERDVIQINYLLPSVLYHHCR